MLRPAFLIRVQHRVRLHMTLLHRRPNDADHVLPWTQILLQPIHQLLLEMDRTGHHYSRLCNRRLQLQLQQQLLSRLQLLYWSVNEIGREKNATRNVNGSGNEIVKENVNVSVNENVNEKETANVNENENVN